MEPRALTLRTGGRNRMVIRGETSAQEIAAIASDERFRVKSVSEHLADYDGPDAVFIRYLATEPTLPDALAHPVESLEHGSSGIGSRVTNPAAHRLILEALKRGEIEITDEVEANHGLL